MNTLSDIASMQGEYDTAIARARESAEVFRRLGDKGGEALALNNMGVAELYRGDYWAALGHFQQSLTLYRNTGNHDGEIEAFNNMGNVFYFQGKYLDALRTYEAAMDLVNQTVAEPSNSRRRQITVTNLATLYQRLAQDERALELYRQLLKSPGALSPSEQAQLLANLGALYRRLGDPLKALEKYRAAQRLLAGEHHLDRQLSVLKNIGILLALDMGDLRGALKAFTRALALAARTHTQRQAMQAHLYRGEALYRLNQPRSAEQEFETALAAAKELGAVEEQWKALYGLGRAAKLTGNEDLAAGYFRQAIAAIESVRSRLQLTALKSEFLADKREVYDVLIELLLHKPETAELFNLVERSRARTFQDRLQTSALQVPSSPSALTLNAVQARLDDSSLLLEFWVTPRESAALWVTRDEAGIVRKSFSQADLQEIWSFLRGVPAGAGDWEHQSEVLSGLLLSGIEPLGHPRFRHLLIVPDGILNSVPFELLRTMGGAGSRLVERFDISYLPTALLLLRNPPDHTNSWRFPWSRRLVAFGDPVVSSRLRGSFSEVLPGEESRGRLPKSAEEIRAIAQISGGRAELYLGTADLKRYLLQGRARGVPMLHLSTHATADVENPERSRILFSPEREEGTADYLFLREIYDFDLRGVELATLSACDTERGKLITGEGVQGFSRALLSAGSRTTVTSLWRVTDQATAEFMKQFYYALSQGKPKAEALRLAKLKFLRSSGSLQHPRYWAGFVLNGDGLEPVPQVLSWSTLFLALGVALIGFAVLVQHLL